MKKNLRLAAVVFALVLALHCGAVGAAEGSGFVRTKGLHFVVDGGVPFFANGFNAYWMMTVASDPSQRGKPSAALRDASTHGLTVGRTWAFSDGGGNYALQTSPGVYNEQTFQGLDFVLSEANKYGIRLILSLVNNYESFGGKQQYVQWARDQGQSIASEDEFFTNPVVKAFYRNHVKTVLTRVNTITGVAYKDDPTIFAWELMNEPRCPSDLSGNTVKEWIREMAAYLKSIDSNHLLEAGLEGFYRGLSIKQTHPTFRVGTDFITNNQIPGIDFATIHLYPDQWLPISTDASQLAFLSRWLDIHIEDAKNVLQKPLLVTEFGKKVTDRGSSINRRDAMFRTVYSKVYRSARSGGACAGSLFWQLMAQGMDSYGDGYEIVLGEAPSTTRVITTQSRHLRSLGGAAKLKDKRGEVKGENKGLGVRS